LIPAAICSISIARCEIAPTPVMATVMVPGFSLARANHLPRGGDPERGIDREQHGIAGDRDDGGEILDRIIGQVGTHAGLIGGAPAVLKNSV